MHDRLLHLRRQAAALQQYLQLGNNVPIIQHQPEQGRSND
jgi:hypothetical protein